MKRANVKSNIADVNTLVAVILVAFSKQSFVNDSYLTSLVNRLTDMLDKFVKAINQARISSDRTPIDQHRDSLVRCLFLGIDFKLLHPDVSVQTPAQVINQVTQRYGLDMIRKSFSDESRDITAMLSDLSVSPVSDAIASLQDINTVVQALTNVQKQFIENEDKYAEIKLANEELLPAYKLCPMLLDILNTELVTYLYTMSSINPAEYATIYAIINTHIEENNARVRNRKPATKPEEVQIN